MQTAAMEGEFQDSCIGDGLQALDSLYRYLFFGLVLYRAGEGRAAADRLGC